MAELNSIRETVRERYAAAAKAATNRTTAACCAPDTLAACCEPVAKADRATPPQEASTPATATHMTAPREQPCSAASGTVSWLFTCRVPCFRVLA
jgi:hypothetical protein